MYNRILVEICCGSAQDVITAAEAGADRAELSSCLYFGGLTPSVGTVIAAKDSGIPIMAMVRPREGGFIYDEAEKRIMLLDAQAMTGAGADGIVFGALTKDGKIDVDLCRRIIEAAEGRETVFHRAFDLLGHNWQRELEKLIDLLANNPRKRFNIPMGCDFSVWDLRQSYYIEPEGFQSMGKSTPFAGWKVSGKCLATVCGGKLVWLEKVRK